MGMHIWAGQTGLGMNTESGQEPQGEHKALGVSSHSRRAVFRG